MDKKEQWENEGVGKDENANDPHDESENQENQVCQPGIGEDERFYFGLATRIDQLIRHAERRAYLQRLTLILSK